MSSSRGSQGRSPGKNPPVEITIEDENKKKMHAASVEMSQKPKAFITQPRTGSKLSQLSDNFSIGLSTATAGQYQSTVTGQSKSELGPDGSSLVTRPNNGEGDSGIDEEKGGSPDLDAREQLDKVYPLPEGWPRLQDKLFKRRALFFRKPMPPSIQKAVEQLQLLQDRIEAWSREVELEILSQHSSMVSAVSSHHTVAVGQPPGRQAGLTGSKLSHTNGRVRKHLRFATDSENSESRLSSTPSIPHISPRNALHSASVSTHSPDLSIQGMGVEFSEIGSFSDIENEPVPRLGAEEVIDEVVTLLGRLETDRSDTDALFRKERVRVEWLQGKIDRISQKRMYELPRAVQREHEACATDIAELKWHCAYRGRQKDRINGQVDNATMLNARLLEDIAFVEKHCPLVEEKLELERGAMKRIDEAQEQTEQELNRTTEKLKRTENKSSEAHGKADMEKEHIKKELESVHEALKKINHELEAAKVLHTTYTNQCHDLRQKIKNSEQEKVVQETKENNARAAEKLQVSKVKQIQDMIVEAEFEHRKEADKISDLNNRIDTLRKEHRELVTRLETLYKERLATLRTNEQDCREMIMTIDDIEAKLKHCKKQKVADAKNTERIKREMKKVDMQLAVVDDEYQKIKVINVAVRNKLTGEEDKAQVLEDSLKSTVDSLKKQLKEETHSRTILQARITADTTDLAKKQIEAKKKKAKVTQKAKEIDEVVEGVLTEVKKLRAQRADRQQTTNKINQTVEDLKTAEEDLRVKTAGTKAELDPKDLLMENLNTQKRLDHMAYRTDLVNKKLEEMAQSEGFMNRVIKNTSEVIEEMSANVEEMTIQLETGQKQQRELQTSLDSVQGRMGKLTSGHLEYMQARREVLEHHLTELTEALILNKELAHQYRELQQHFFKIKEESINLLEKRIGLESSLKDHKQLNGLQVHLHHALAHYFFIRGLYNQNELARFEDMSEENKNRIGELQRNMDYAIATIGTFLNDQVDGTAARMVTAAASTALLEDDAKGTPAVNNQTLLTAGSMGGRLDTMTVPRLKTPAAIKTN